MDKLFLLEQSDLDSHCLQMCTFLGFSMSALRSAVCNYDMNIKEA